MGGYWWCDNLLMCSALVHTKLNKNYYGNTCFKIRYQNIMQNLTEPSTLLDLLWKLLQIFELLFVVLIHYFTATILTLHPQSPAQKLSRLLLHPALALIYLKKIKHLIAYKSESENLKRLTNWQLSYCSTIYMISGDRTFFPSRRNILSFLS